MPTKYRYQVRIYDPAVVAALKAAAQANGESLSGFATVAVCEALDPKGHASEKARQACPRCSKVRARAMATKRRRAVVKGESR